MIALYSLHVMYQFSCRIPKKNGKGFLKQALGGHHFTDDTRRFNDAMHELGDYARDFTDIDGYLSIDQPALFGKQREDDAEILMKALSVTFPRITKWKEVSFTKMAFA